MKEFFVFNQEDNLVESSYARNSSDHALEHYYQQPPDYDRNTLSNQRDITGGPK